MVMSKNNATHSISGTGWTQCTSSFPQTNSGASFTFSLWKRLVDGTEGVPTVSWSGSVAAASQIVQINGADSTTPIGAVSTAKTGTTSPWTTNAVNTTAPNSTVFIFAFGAANTSFATPTNWTGELDNGNATGASRNAAKQLAVPASGTSSGATSATGPAAAWVAVQIEFLALVNSSPTRWATNTADKSSNITLSAGNTTAAASSATAAGVRGTTYKSSGLVYFEWTINSSTDLAIGFSNIAESLADNLGQSLNSLAYFQGGAVQINATTITTIQTWAAGNTVCMAIDWGTKLVWFRTDGGNWNNNALADPILEVTGISFSTMNAGPYTVYAGFDISGDSVTGNWGATSFAQTVPTGYSAWDVASPGSTIMRRTTGQLGTRVGSRQAA